MATVVITFWLCSYYNVIIAWAMFYLISSVEDPLPWTGCNNHWNTDRCWDVTMKNVSSHDGAANARTKSSTQEFYE